MPVITINKNNFLKGESFNEFTGEGGFTNKLKGINLNYKDGILAPCSVKTETDADDPGAGIIPFGVCPFNGTSSLGLIACSNATDDLTLFKVNTNGTLDDQDTDTTRNYVLGKSDILLQSGNYFISSTTNVAEGASLGSLDQDWWTTTIGASALDADFVHYFLAKEGSIYLTNGVYIYSINVAGAAKTDVQTLVGEAVTAIGNHNNLVYFATTKTQDEVSGIVTGDNYLCQWDGITVNEISDKIRMPERVYHIQSFNGQLYIFFKDYMAIYDGITVKEIKELSSIPWKHKIKIIDSIMYIANGNDILCFDGVKFWTYYEGASTITAMVKYGTVDDFYFVESNKVYKFDLDAITGTGKFASLWYDFGQKVIVRKVILELAEVMVANDVNTVKLLDESETATTVMTMTYANEPTKRIKQSGDINFKCSSLMLELDTYMNLIKNIYIVYEELDEPV
jgi:hypothetical protein